MRVRRVHHPGVSPGADALRLSREESRHVLRVLRLQPGDPVSVFDGKGREWDAVISGVDGEFATLAVQGERSDRVDPDLRVTLFQGACRSERMDWVVQKGTEIGVAAIVPVVSRRVEAGRRAASRTARWQRIAVEACKQCGRRLVPEIGDAVALPPTPDPQVPAVLLHPGVGSRPLRDILGGPAPDAVWVAVGPEGGFDPDEVADLEARGWKPVGLGPRVLRAETAGVIAAGVVLHVWGDLGSGKT